MTNAKAKLYDVVKKILEKLPETRDSNRKLIWEVWKYTGATHNEFYLSRQNFMSAPASESITRTRRMVQNDHPHLGASEEIESFRRGIESQKGTHVYRETV